MSQARAAEPTRAELRPAPLRGRARWVRHGLSNRRFYQGIALGCSHLPMPMLQAISAVGNAIAITLMRQTVAEVSANYRRAFAFDEQRSRAMARRVFFDYGLTTVDLFRTRVGGPRRIPRLDPHLRDDRILTQAAPPGRGCLVVTGHLGNWELGAIYLAEHGLKVAVMGQPELDPDIQALRDEIRSRFGIEWIEIGSSSSTAFKVRDAVERGFYVALLVDRAYPEDRVTVELFGRPTPFLRSPALLARFCDCALVPCYLFRNRGGTYRSFFADPIRLDPRLPEAAADRRAMAAVAAALEQGIRSEPTQWYNFFDYWGSGPVHRPPTG